MVWRTVTARTLLALACCLVATGLLLPFARYYMDVDLVTVRGMADPLVGAMGCAAAVGFVSGALRGTRRSLAPVFTAGLALAVTAVWTGPSGASIHRAGGFGLLVLGLALGACGDLLVERT